MPRDPFIFVFSPYHEPSDVLQKYQWDLALCAQLDEVRALLSGLRKQNPIVRNDADGHAMDVREPCYQRCAKARLEFIKR